MDGKIYLVDNIMRILLEGTEEEIKNLRLLMEHSDNTLPKEVVNTVERDQMINFHIDVMKIGLIEEGERKWSEDYRPLIEKTASDYYDTKFTGTQI